jgi:hypothetical protein
MLGACRFKGCPRCGGDLLDEPGLSQLEAGIRYVSCLQCGELRYVVLRQSLASREELRGKPGRPRKDLAV